MSECSTCGGSGLVMRGSVAVQCSCVRDKKQKSNYAKAGLTPLMHSFTFDKFDFRYYAADKTDEVKGISYAQTAKITFQAAKNFTKNFIHNPHQEGLLFSGPVGSGKTFLACCIANALLQQGIQVLFVVVPDWLDQIRASYDANTELNEQNLLSAAREVPVLILDDLGVHNYTEWTKNKLYSIINYRLNYQLPTIITTNLSVAQLSEYLGERTSSRIFQMCRIYRLLVDNNIRYVKRIEQK